MKSSLIITTLFLFGMMISGCDKEDIAEENIEKEDPLTPTFSIVLTEHTVEDQMGPFAENAMAVFNAQVWSVGGFNAYSGGVESSDVWKSDNGVNWVSVTQNQFAGRTNHTLTVYDDALWLIGGIDPMGTFLNDVWRSVDGENWILITDSPAYLATAYHEVVVFNNRLYLIKPSNSTGRSNSVWSSSDGVVWREETDNAFPSRELFEALVFENELYVLGGQNSGGPMNEVWKSVDGINWSEVVTGSIFTPRQSHTATLYNGKVWVAGGYGLAGPEGNLWYSDDMENWFEYEPIRAPEGLYDHAALHYRDEVWLFGGREGRPGGTFPMTGKIRSFKETSP